MASAVAKYAAKKMLSSEMNKYKSKGIAGPYDPYYDQVTNPRTGKTKKVKKQIPAWIPEHDANILAKARKSAYRLDFALFNAFGLRFGWSSVIGLAPIFGDFADVALSGLLISRMKKVEGGLPQNILLRMYLYLILDFVFGLVPILGDFVDAYFKCNGYNVRLLEEHLDAKYKPAAVRDVEAREAAAEEQAEARLPQDQRKHLKKKAPRPATVYEDFSDEENDRRGQLDDRHEDVRQPTRAYSGRRDRVADEEMGIPHQQRPSESATKSGRRH